METRFIGILRSAAKAFAGVPVAEPSTREIVIRDYKADLINYIATNSMNKIEANPFIINGKPFTETHEFAFLKRRVGFLLSAYGTVAIVKYSYDGQEILEPMIVKQLRRVGKDIVYLSMQRYNYEDYAGFYAGTEIDTNNIIISITKTGNSWIYTEELEGNEKKILINFATNKVPFVFFTNNAKRVSDWAIAGNLLDEYNTLKNAMFINELPMLIPVFANNTNRTRKTASTIEKYIYDMTGSRIYDENSYEGQINQGLTPIVGLTQSNLLPIVNTIYDEILYMTGTQRVITGASGTNKHGAEVENYNAGQLSYITDKMNFRLYAWKEFFQWMGVAVDSIEWDLSEIEDKIINPVSYEKDLIEAQKKTNEADTKKAPAKKEA